MKVIIEYITACILLLISGTCGKPQPIGPNDIVSVRGDKLYKKDGTRFFVKGIGFPVPVDVKQYNASSWISILHQLNDLELDYNTIRIYRMNPKIDYTTFFEEAAKLGVYVMVPLTAAEGKGVLSRDLSAPNCYPRGLYHYGAECIKNYAQFPNVLAGVIGNEVINSLEAWSAAPCIKAYATGLKAYMETSSDRPLPLVYATQHSAMGAEMQVSDAVRLTSEYLTCERVSSKRTNFPGRHEEPSQFSIDIFGVNVESWCSSKDTFELSEKGTAGPYLTLWNDLRNSTTALVMTEMGCSHRDYNHDNGLQGKDGWRDWNQIPIVLNEMSDKWSGFFAYAYWGNQEFNMFQGGPWDGKTPLKPTDDFKNFRDQLANLHQVGQAYNSSNVTHEQLFANHPKMCSEVESELRTRFGVNLYNSADIPIYGRTWYNSRVFYYVLLVLSVLILSAVLRLLWLLKLSRKSVYPYSQLNGSADEENNAPDCNGVNYGAIECENGPTVST